MKIFGLSVVTKHRGVSQRECQNTPGANIFKAVPIRSANNQTQTTDEKTQ